MSRARAALGSLAFLVIAPGAAAGWGPWLLTRWEAGSTSLPGETRLRFVRL